tara:strand:+ start:24289 stop:24918 length:630 start_codon:yes stop_codon:yes gene_type:complete
MQAILWALLSELNWPKESIILSVLCLGYFITGGLHLDGLMDTADGLAAGEGKRLEAMRDSRVGASGVQFFILIILCQIAALLKLGNTSVLIIPLANFWGRVGPLWAIDKFKYLHKKGSGALHKSHWQGYKNELKPSLYLLLIVSIYLLFDPISIDYSLKTIIYIWSGIIPAIIVPHIIGKKFGGHTGDTYGATVVLVETFILCFFALFL